MGEEYAYDWGANERMEVSFQERLSRRGLRSSRLCDSSAFITEDGRIDTTSKTSGTEIGVCANPVVVDGLIGVQLLDISKSVRSWYVDNSEKRLTTREYR